MNFNDWSKRNQGKTLNDYYHEVGQTHQVTDTNSQKRVIVEHHHHYSESVTASENSNSIYLSLVGSILGLIGFYLPFLKVVRISQDVNLFNGLLSFNVGIGTDYAFSLSNFCSLIKDSSTQDTNERILANLVSYLPFVLVVILFLSFIQWKYAKSFFEILFVLLLSFWFLNIGQISNYADIQYQIGSYLLLLSSLSFSADIFSKLFIKND